MDNTRSAANLENRDAVPDSSFGASAGSSAKSFPPTASPGSVAEPAARTATPPASVAPRITLEAAKRFAQDLERADDPNTAFVKRVSHHIEIDEACRTFLRALQSGPMVIREGVDIYTVESELRDMYVLQSGWLLGYSHTPNGQRHVFRIYQPGDMIGVEDINWSYRTSSVATATACVLTAFTKAELRRVFDESPRLSRTVFSMAMLDRAMLFDQLRAIGRMNAEARLATLLLQLYSRARLTGAVAEDVRGWSFHMPLTQSELGDTIGLTNVSVSRAMGTLVDQGLLVRSGKVLTFPRPEDLVEMCDFTDRFLHVDRDWSMANGERVAG